MSTAKREMPEPTADEMAEWTERMLWQEYIAPRDVVRMEIHNGEVVTMDAADLAEFCAFISAAADTALTELESVRADRAMYQPYISQWNEYAEIAAEVYAATNDYELPY